MAANFMQQYNFEVLPFTSQPGHAFNEMELVDLNRDGIQDIVAMNSRTAEPGAPSMVLSVGIGIGNVAYQFTRINVGTTAAQDGANGVLGVADLTGDGNLDIVVGRFTDPNLFILPGTGTGTFGTTRTVPLNPGEVPTRLVTGDFNADGRQDMAVAIAGSPSVGIFNGTGNGSFTRGNVPVGNTVQTLAAGDLDNDGTIDLAVGTPTTMVMVREMNQTFGTTTTAPANNVSLVAIGRVRSTDALPKVIVQVDNPNQSGQRLFKIFDRSAGTETTIATLVGDPARQIKMADVDADGYGDLLFNLQQRVLIGYGNPNGSFTSPVDLIFAASPRCMAVGDLNNDGALDLIVGNEVTAFSYRLQETPESLVVNTAVDEDNGNARPNNGTGTSLREAWNFASRLGGSQTITFASGLNGSTLNITAGLMQTSSLANTSNIAIDAAASRITLQGNNTSSLFVVNPSSSLSLRNLTIRNFTASLTNVDGNGGVIDVGSGGQLNIAGSTFVGNAASGARSVIFADGNSQVAIRNSTFNANTGTGVLSLLPIFGGTAILENNTLVGNDAGLRMLGGRATLRNNIFSNTGADITLQSNGALIGSNNVIRSGPTTGLTATTNADPQLSPLANNGGPTQTMLPSLLSPVLDAGVTSATLTTDQRGIARPQYGAPDIGAVELSSQDLASVGGVTTADGAVWFIFPATPSGSDRPVYRKPVNGPAVQVPSGFARRLSLSSDGTVIIQNVNNQLFSRPGSQSGIGTTWEQLAPVTAGDGAYWFIVPTGTGPDGIIQRWAEGNSIESTGGLASQLARALDGSIVAKTSTNVVFSRVGSAGGVGTAWNVLQAVTAGDGAAWFIGTDGNGRIYRWDNATNLLQVTNGSGDRIGVVNGVVFHHNADRNVFLGVGSASGLNSTWTFVPRVVTADSATWFIAAATGTEGGIFRWTANAAPADSGGVGRILGLMPSGSIVTENSSNIFVRLGSANSLGSTWAGTSSAVLGADGARWFTNPEDAGPDQAILRWANGSNPVSTGGAGRRVARADNHIVTQTSVGEVFHRVGSNNGIGSAWSSVSRANAGDGATWFVNAPAGQQAPIFRWAVNSIGSTAAAGVTMSTTPLGDIRTVTNASQTFQAINSRLGFSSNWQLLSESLVVTTNVDENDFTSSPNIGTGTSLREAIAYANANPGADSITFGNGATNFLDTTPDTITLGGTRMELTTGPITITGPGANLLTIDGNNASQIFSVDSGVSATMVGMTLTRGYAKLLFQPFSTGGAIVSSGDLTVRQMSINGNRAETSGGGIASLGSGSSVTVNESTINGNRTNV